MSSFVELIRNITPDVYESLKLAVEIGKWPDGRKPVSYTHLTLPTKA